MQIAQVFSKAWQAYKKNWLQLFYANFLFGLVFVLFLSFLIMGILILSDLAASLILILFSFVVVIFLLIPLTGGIIHLSYAALKKSVHWKEMFMFSKKHWLPILMAFIVQFIIIGIIFLPSHLVNLLYPSFKSFKYFLIHYLVQIPSYLVALLFQFILYAKVIENLPIINCIKRSFEVVKSNYVELLIILLVYFLIFLVSAFFVLFFIIFFIISIIGIPIAIALIIVYFCGFLLPLHMLLYVSYYSEAIKKSRKRFK